MNLPAPPSPGAASTSTVEAFTQVQFEAATYVDQAAALLGLSIPPELRAGVVANFEHIQTIAQPVVDFSLPDTIESAATFEP